MLKAYKIIQAFEKSYWIILAMTSHSLPTVYSEFHCLTVIHYTKKISLYLFYIGPFIFIFITFLGLHYVRENEKEWLVGFPLHRSWFYLHRSWLFHSLIKVK